MGKKVEDQEIDWDDPAAVAAARGDDATDEGGTDDGEKVQTEEEETNAEAEVLEAEGKEAEGKTEEELAAEEKAEAAEKKKEPMLPKSRYDKKAAEAKRLAQENDALRRKQAAEQKADTVEEIRTGIDAELAELDAQINKAIAEDEMEEATRLRGVARAKERELWNLDLDLNAEETTNATREQVRLDLTIDHIENTYGEFDPDSDDYSQDTVDKVQELRAGFQATGKYTPTQALLRAMDYVLPKKDMADVKGAADAADKKAAKEAELTKAGLKKATDAAKKQPPDATGVGDDADSAGLKEAPDVDKLTYEDVASLPEATLQRMRGDTVS